MKYCIIGSNSFSGSNFANHLLKKDNEVIGISRSPEPNRAYLPYKWSEENESQMSFFQLDINSDLSSIIDLLNDHKPNVIINFAAQGMVAQSWEAPLDWYKTNVVSQVALHDQLRKLSFVKKYLHFSTPEVYGSTDNWTKEHFHFKPSTPYAVSRAACDLHLMSFFKTYRFPVIFTRAANVYGPGQQLYRIVPRAVLSAKLGERIPLHGDGVSTRCFVHITDVCEATELICQHGTLGESYHISNNTPISILDLVTLISKKFEIPVHRLTTVSKERLGKDGSYLLDSNKVRRELSWAPKIELDQGIDSVTRWVDKNIQFLETEPRHYVHRK